MSSPIDYFYWLFLTSAIVSIHYDNLILESYTEKQDFIFQELKGLQHAFSPTTINWLQESLHWSACASSRRIRRCTNTAPKHGKKHTLLYLTFVLLSIASDVELNPGPRALKYPCQICSRAVTWNQRGVACDDCDGWYHVQCMGMTTQVYEALNDPNVSWQCVKCGLPQFSSSLFFYHTQLETSNTFETLDLSTDNTTGYRGSDAEQDTISSSSSSTASFGPPQHTSSPTKRRKKGSKQEQQLRSMKILNVNFQSIRNKKEELVVLIESTKPSIIIGTETWLNSSIFTSEIFPPSYSVVRKDRVGCHGGVLLAVRSDLTYTTLQIQDEGEHDLYTSNCRSILEHLDDFNILSDAQHGFRKRRSCTSQLLLTIQDLSSGIDSRDQIDVILLDLSKAFDKVPRGRLLHKIHYYGIQGSTHNWVEEFLRRRSQRVLLDGCTSHTPPVLSGVPQGSVVGPLLFVLFVNGLPDCISAKSKAKLFAYDCILYRKVSSADDAECLQKDLDALQEWEVY